MSAFKGLGIHIDYIKGLNELGINTPTEIQEKAIPKLINSKIDFIGLAQTGTGKTAAYGLPLLHQIDPNKPVIQSLILSPTRELAQQIKKQLFKFTKYVDHKIFLEGVYGGEKIDKQIKALQRTTHLVVATPGRLIDLIERGAINISQVQTLVLDEADEMLSMGFKQDINRILKYTNGKANTWLFSATFPQEIDRIVKTYMSSSAEKVEVNKDSLVNENITHLYVKTSLKEKNNTLIRLLESRGTDRGIVFCRTKAGTQNLSEFLKEEGFSVDALEGDMQQRDREKVMRKFKKETIDILVSTDVSARGIDVNDLGFVIHHQLPEKLEYYTHRSGRTARAGKTGYSISLLIPSDLHRIKELESGLGIKFVETKI
ncbi:MAG: ATP-dependent RNA helicase DeaD [Urechidicola sp.]|jgi:ATP-dependent RNA helicase DeaD|tara:strand:- start:1800 stop:2918 length:1119 start_codon:yes stop_codon:yes gene_type:complete